MADHKSCICTAFAFTTKNPNSPRKHEDQLREAQNVFVLSFVSLVTVVVKKLTTSADCRIPLFFGGSIRRG
jgi:hypothetical protein